MEPNLSASEYAKRKLIIAAIHLFAEYGVDSVSLRMINREAGHKNNSALHYHFGSKLGLIEAVDHFIQQHFDEVRETALAALEDRASDGDIGLREILEALVNPYVEIIQTHDWGYEAIRTIARMEFDGNAQVHNLLEKSAGDAVKRFARLLRPQLPGLKPRDFRRRVNFVVNSTILGFADYRNLHQTYLGDLSTRSLAELAKFHVDMSAAILNAPS
ncbi:TetR family transcriptional regulator [Pseudohaliea sp.]|uniref:TetR/AcrR family transcriptional regulator n=1 Tax=Pseudohaliea sp. TaxID=2740289 RepID=UPI0032ED09F1